MSSKYDLDVHFFHDYRSLPFPRKKLEKTVEDIIVKEKKAKNKTVNVIFCSNYKIKKLNSLYRKINKTTDVLSFYLGDDFLLLVSAEKDADTNHVVEQVIKLYYQNQD